MRIKTSQNYAVITGDVVRSSKMDAPLRRQLHKAMVATNKAFFKTFRQIAPLGVQIFSGDSWQTVLTKPELSLHASLFYRMRLRAEMGMRSVDTRACIGIGKIKFIPEKNIAEGDGPAFQISGRGLSEMPRNARLLIFHENETDPALKTLIALLDALAQRCSNRQALAVSLALTGKTQEEIAQRWTPGPISQQAAATHLDKAGWDAIQQALSYYENYAR